MKTEDIAAAPPSPWQPEDDVLILAVVGKCVEEGGEFFAKLGRIIVQGIDGLDPVTKLPQNRAELADEVADMLANLSLLQARLFPERGHEIQDRAVRKQAYLGAWHEQLEGGDLDTADLFDPLREPRVQYRWEATLDPRAREAHVQAGGGGSGGVSFVGFMPPRDLGRFDCRGNYVVYDGPTIHLAPGDIDADGYVISEAAKAFVRSLGFEPAVRPPSHLGPTNRPGARR